MNYKQISLFLLSAVVAVMFTACSSCSSKKEQTGPQQTEFEAAMTAKDTAAVKQIVDQFFTYAKEKNFSEAAGMLYRNNKDVRKAPEQLNNEEMAEVRKMLETIPMVGYRIEYIKFDERYRNEVMCRVIIKEAEGDMPEITTKMFFKPVNTMGTWVLCLLNSEYGDRGLVDPDKRDSLERKYQSNEKAAAKAEADTTSKAQ